VDEKQWDFEIRAVDQPKRALLKQYKMELTPIEKIAAD
jgi:hypothetical protein